MRLLFGVVISLVQFTYECHEKQQAKEKLEHVKKLRYEAWDAMKSSSYES